MSTPMMIVNATETTMGPLLTHALDVQAKYERQTSLDDRKKKGQFFTPPEVCAFMASLFSPKPPATFRLLDPGAGVGSLTAAICDRILYLRSSRNLEIHLFENDPEVLPFLRETIKHCVEMLNEHGHSMTYEIHAKDFILDAAASIFGPPSLFNDSAQWGEFDGVIMNPPYFKVAKASPYARVMEDVVHGQPNIYAFFLAAAAQMLRPGGELVAITPGASAMAFTSGDSGIGSSRRWLSIASTCLNPARRHFGTSCRKASSPHLTASASLRPASQ